MEERLKTIELNIGELIRQHYASRLLVLALFAAHPDRKRVLECYNFFLEHNKSLSLGLPIEDELMNATNEAGEEFGKLLNQLAKVEIPKH